MINITYDGLTLDQVIARFDPKIVEKAMARTQNRIMDKSSTALSKKVREKFVLLARDVNETRKKYRAVAGRGNDAVLEYLGARIPLSKFKPKTRMIRVTSQRTGKKIKRRGVTVRVTKQAGRKLIKSVPAFLVKRGTEVAARKTEERESYTTPSTISVPEMIQAREALQEFYSLVERDFSTEFERNMDFYLDRFDSR